MKSQTITLDPEQSKLLAKELLHLEEIRRLLLTVIPESYLTPGSDLWWAKSDLEAREDIKNGRYTEVKTHEELDRFLNNLR